MTKRSELTAMQRRILIFNSARGMHLANITKALDGIGLLAAPLVWHHDDGTETLTEREARSAQLILKRDQIPPLELDEDRPLPLQVADALSALSADCLDAAERVLKVRLPDEELAPQAYVMRDDDGQVIETNYLYWPSVTAAQKHFESTGRNATVNAEPLSDHPDCERRLIDALQFTEEETAAA